MQFTPLPTVERLSDLLHYEEDTGEFYWKVRVGRAKAGSRAGYLDKEGYWLIGIDGDQYYAHRLAFKILHGRDPIEVDHRHGTISDASWNLREADREKNNRNMPRRKDNRSGFKGVHWDASKGKWIAMIGVGAGKQRNLGAYADKETAYGVYCAAAKEVHGAFARLS